MKAGIMYRSFDDVARQDRSYRLAMEEARELGITIDIEYDGKGADDPEGVWMASGWFESQPRSPGKWVNDEWVDSDDDYYSEQVPLEAIATGYTAGSAAWGVIRKLVDKASI
jgi:hypothetical protein